MSCSITGLAMSGGWAVRATNCFVTVPIEGLRTQTAPLALRMGTNELQQGGVLLQAKPSGLEALHPGCGNAAQQTNWLFARWSRHSHRVDSCRGDVDRVLFHV